MKLIAASIFAALLPMGALQAQKVQVGFGIRIGLPSVHVVVPRKAPTVHVRRDRGAPDVRVVRPAPRGHWIVQRYRHWVPATYGYRCDAHGHRFRFVVRAGHFEIRFRRVWVPAQRQEHRVYPRTRKGHGGPARAQRRTKVRPEPIQRHRIHPEPVPGGPGRNKRPQGRRTRVGVLYS